MEVYQVSSFCARVVKKENTPTASATVLVTEIKVENDRVFELRGS